ncbi:MAG: hypothetical protein JO263_03150, partial [Candidatus Eremiobacteraeota bacterium]|nr:hypothetical protein [Candidatus Eremiobacteraeota bacterium]
MSGLLAALWLVGLFAAAPALRTSKNYGVADRLRDGLILGVAIPFVLGFVHLLYPAACWAALFLLAVLGYLRDAPRVPVRNGERPRYLLAGALIAVAWPQLMRPLLDGDSLSYHLPNAAAWVQAHSLWMTATHYWWYPPASELFAAGLYAVASPYALPWCGLGALALMGFRIASWSRTRLGAPPLLADALAAATITAFPLAIQGATLQNDVWLAAFWLETLYWLSCEPSNAAIVRCAALTALLKPQGFLLSAIALGTFKARPRVWLAASLALALWIAHDALLWHGGGAAIFSGAGYWESTIVAHGLPAIGEFLRVTLFASPFALLAFLAAFFGPLIERKSRALGWAAGCAALAFFVLPFGYATAVAQLATGASLRFAAPAMAVGAVLLARPARRVSGIATALLVASTLFGIGVIFQIFWNDGSTHVALPIALVAAGVAAAAHRWRAHWLVPIAGAAAIVLATHLAARHPLDYYTDSLRVGNTAPGIYRWIATQRPRAVGGWGVRLGVINVLSPATHTVDLPDSASCAYA